MNYAKPLVVTGKMFDREPPHSLESEVSLLGCMMLSTDAMHEAAMTVTAPDFYEAKHASLFSAIADVYRVRDTFDLVLLQDLLRQRGVYDLIGGADRLDEIVNSVPVSANAPHYARIVSNTSRARRLIAAMGAGCHALYTSEDIGETIGAIEAEVLAAARESTSPESVSVAEVGNEIANAWETGFKPEDEVLYPWTDMNAKVGGLRRGELIVVAARPSQGKTAWGLQLGMAAGWRVPVTFYSLEMRRTSLLIRDLCVKLKASWRETLRGEVDMGRAVHEIGKLSENQMRIEDQIQRKWEPIQSHMRREVSKRGTRIFVVDYIGMLRSTQRFDRRDQELSHIAYEMQRTAKDLGVTVITLAQINRGGTAREGSRPTLSDIKESGGIEEAADAAILLHRPEYYHLHELEAWRSANPDDAGIAEMLVAKNRNGPTGVVRTKWVEDAMQFVDNNEGRRW